jgi:hypothetical protein
MTEDEVQVIERATRQDERIRKGLGWAEEEVRSGLEEIMYDLGLGQL